MVRDRLAELQSRSTEDGESRTSKKEKNGTPLLSSEQQLTECLDRVTLIDNKIRKMRDDVEEMSKLQRNIVSNPLIDKSEVKRLDQTSDRVFNTSTQIQKEINSYRQEVKDLYLDPNHERVVKTHLDRLNKDVTRTMNDFRGAQVDYIEKSQKIHHKKVEIVGGEASTSEAVDPSQVQTSVFGADFLMEAQKAKMELREIEQRDAEIKKIENSVIMVNALFKEINALIMEQGETLDTIEKHVLETNVAVESAGVQLHEARTYQEKARRKKICCIGILVAVLVIAGIIIAIVIVTNKKDEKST
ncbi:syntaxin-1A homolog [Dreissena polymorpha]|uniref:t-SNARE coiled-coil homology domain-containing protein n=1 Tax=Dreissena polymorpha TaxID=45954 RepID=A0A9D4KWU9_DREPO|nr:syntaxin-1A homolog [Dreissena polymorpha]XP_052236230.1 syntaxin-1A homolog [Dreissena polymorpha]XP_052236231.1 syntaxin-1A homolog [Dreissena polymorpha]XP_052274005.1 syntaxin-1A homolog [Dreissena polymorpha]KAH3747284.1 hypothetical protein DPMN_181708 [Dreissena polymorpha]KAH3847610.1 hypothetical protein DPMN_089937 [Dreissena polymorpha]